MYRSFKERGLPSSNSKSDKSVFKSTVPVADPEEKVIRPFKKDSGAKSEKRASSTGTSSKYTLRVPSTRPRIGPSHITSVTFTFCAVDPLPVVLVALL